MTAFTGKKGCSSCNKPKDEECGLSPAVLQINNPSECVMFHKVTIPASMGNEVTIPPDPGKYRNALVYYEASGNAYMYTSDGMPVLLSYTDYLRLMNKPTINGVTLAGDKTLEEIGVNDATLTIKQDGATLGTFSANASQDTEINIPAGGGTQTQKNLHIYVPDDIHEASVTDAGLVRLQLGAYFEIPEITVKNDDETTITPDQFVDMFDELYGYNLIIHVPEFPHLYIEGAYHHVPATTLYYPVTAVAENIPGISMLLPSYLDTSDDLLALLAGTDTLGAYIGILEQPEGSGRLVYTAEIILPES